MSFYPLGVDTGWALFGLAWLAGLLVAVAVCGKGRGRGRVERPCTPAAGRSALCLSGVSRQLTRQPESCLYRVPSAGVTLLFGLTLPSPTAPTPSP